MRSSAAVPVENIPGIVKAIPGSGENRSPSRRNRCSPSARNPVHLHPGTLFTFAPESFSPSPGIRNRDGEFVDPPVTREGLMETWEAGWSHVFATLEPPSDADLGRTVTIRGAASGKYVSQEPFWLRAARTVGEGLYARRKPREPPGQSSGRCPPRRDFRTASISSNRP